MASPQESADPELQQFLAMEQQKAQMQGTIHKMTDTCWETCVDRPKDKLDYKTEACLTNCVDRFLDTTLQITSRFQQILSKNMAQ